MNVQLSSVVYNNTTGPYILTNYELVRYDTQSYDISFLQLLAPEFLMYNSYTSKSDVWMYGVMLYQLMELHNPFTGMTKDDIVREQRSFSLKEKMESLR